MANHSYRRVADSASFLLAAVLFCACSDALIQPLGNELSNANDRLTLRGRVCTAVPDPTGFPVKVVFIVDESGSMCVSDPPGSQQGSAFCERTDIQAIVPPGVTTPARVRALQQLLNQFRTQPNIYVSLVPFETNVKDVWPPATSGQRFARPNASLDARVATLQTQLGKGTDYQGALDYTYALIAGDIQQTALQNPAILPRTRYVVVFLTDGTPFPRCDANNGRLPVYAGPDNPDLQWADSIGAEDFCHIADPTSPDTITGFIVGTDRNQNYQVFNPVDKLMELKGQYNVADIRFHTILLLNVAAVRACGPICQDLYGAYPGVAPENYPEATHRVAKWLLQQMSARGNGVFQEFLDGQIYSMGLGALDYSSLASRNVVKTMIARSLTSIAVSSTKMDVDTDGDGLPDAMETPFLLKTNKFAADTDGDCFPDAFEVMHADQGFDPLVKDARGCDPNSPATLGCSCRDTDGDGLSQFAEAYLHTNTGLVDSDGDGIPDGLEALYGKNPLVADATIDTDGDGISDLDEIKANTDPRRRDRGLFEREGYQYSLRADPQPNGSVCYDYTVSNIKLFTPPARSGVRQGYNLFKVFFSESPESGVATDYGVWRAGCAWAQYDPPIRDPQGPELVLNDNNFVPPGQLVIDADYLQNCVGTRP